MCDVTLHHVHEYRQNKYIRTFFNKLTGACDGVTYSFYIKTFILLKKKTILKI